jgi:hypothetical protein
LEARTTPEPCPFLNRKFPVCSVIRSTETKGAVKFLTAMGLFNGEPPRFFKVLTELTDAADAVRDHCKG